MKIQNPIPQPIGEPMDMDQPNDELPETDEYMDDEDNMMNDEMIDDPKKNIQRLAGELSQALRTYNMEQESPDTDLNKYVVGMIATQATKEMTSNEKNEIVKKIQKGETTDDDTEDNFGDDVPMEECKQNNVLDDEKDKRYKKEAFDFGKNPFSSRR